MRFTGKKVVITGACGTIGRWIASAFASEGALLCLSDRSEAELKSTVQELGLSRSTVTDAVDLRDEGAIQKFAQVIEAAWGSPDILINNAGLYPVKPLLDITADDWDNVFDVNLRAPFLMSCAFGRLMIAAKVQGSIINMSSGAARQMRNGWVPYCTSKTALERLSKGLALELAPHRIRVNVVEPGFAPGSKTSPLSDEYVEAMTARIPLGRSSGPTDAPGAILYLCSSEAEFITGTVISVDGGNSIGTYEPQATAR